MSNSKQTSKFNSATVAVQTGLNTDTNHNSVVAPIYMATNFKFDTIDYKPPFDYSRGGNPTRDLLANALTELEQGAGAVVTSSGMSAINLVLNLLKPGSTLVAPIDCYGGTYRLFCSLANKGAFNLEWLDYYADDLDKQLTKVNPDLIWIESPSNPLLNVTDIKKVCQVAKNVNARVAVDNTFLSPLGQTPLALGADIVIHSSTKYLNGHSDVVSGAVICASQEDHEELSWWANNTGVTGSPFDSYLILRGIRTLPLRVKQHSENAQALAETLQSHNKISDVFYPGLPNHQHHRLADQQHHSHGGMLSFKIDADQTFIKHFLNSLELFTLAESLGGTESLVCHPGAMTHAAMPAEAQEAAGISENLIRFSVGVEDRGDLVADVLQALAEADKLTKQGTPVAEPKANVAQEEDIDGASCRLSPALAALW